MDVEIFARNLYKMVLMSDRDWITYNKLFDNMVLSLRKPDLIIYLKASTDTLISRVNIRNRDFEKNIKPDYLHRLNISYDAWISNLSEFPVYVINTDNFNIFKEPDKLNFYCDEIRELLN